ncbi:MAG: DUF389 domain-containing protein [Desulfovibrionaceae bacterium]
MRRDILHGSTPRFFYYVLLSISALIASFGLMADSPAVVMGAMLVSPLMTPIFGVSLGLVRGNPPLLRRAAGAVLGGVALAVSVSAGIGLLPLPLELTAEMALRTSPTLLDLLVAILAGTAGCLALIDERISPVLPGIAMATALIPPLSTCGLCLAIGQYADAWGALVLFTANFLGILVVSAAVFIAAGFVTALEIGSAWELIRRFSWALIFLGLVAVLLTHALYQVIESRRIINTSRETLQEGLAFFPGMSIERVLHTESEDTVDVLALVRTPRPLSPSLVQRLEQTITDRLDRPTRLVLRCDISNDVSSQGRSSEFVERVVGDTLVREKAPAPARIIQNTMQALRELLENEVARDLEGVEAAELSGCLVVVARISGRPLDVEHVARFEKVLQQRLGMDNVRLLARSSPLQDMTATGPMLLGPSHFMDTGQDGMALQRRLEQETRTRIQALAGGRDAFMVQAVDAMARNWELEMLPPSQANASQPLTGLSAQATDSAPRWMVKALVAGPRLIAPEQAAAVERSLSRLAGSRVELVLRSQVDAVVTSEGYLPPQRFDAIRR